jgi:hypothetical protein
MDEESAADVDDNDQPNDQPDDPLDANGPELDLGIRNLSQLGAGDPMETNQDAFRTYVTGHVLSFLDSRFRDTLVGNVDAHEFRGQIASLKSAIRRIEFDLMKSRASQFAADGRWRDVLHALDYRPFLTYMFGQLDILPHPVDLQGKLTVYWCVNEVKRRIDRLNCLKLRELTLCFHSPGFSFVCACPTWALRWFSSLFRLFLNILRTIATDAVIDRGHRVTTIQRGRLFYMDHLVSGAI